MSLRPPKIPAPTSKERHTEVHMNVRTAAGAVVVATTLSAVARGQQVDIRDDAGRLVAAARVLNPTDVPRASALYGITVVGAPDGKSVVVSAIRTGSLLRVGDRVDEVQLAGVKDRIHHVNPGYWPYQVWTPSDFYRLATRCVDACLVRLRSIENLPDSRYSNSPRVFAYLPVGTG